MATDPIQRFKVVVVGDGSTGKTSLLLKAAFNEFNETYVPTVFDNYTMQKVIDGETIYIELWDTAGQEDYDRLRPLSYAGSHVFLLCFAINSRISFENVKIRWQPELQHYGQESTPKVLVGLKKDMRPSTPDPKFVSKVEGEALAANISALMYIECSAKTGGNIHQVIEITIKGLIAENKKKLTKRKKRKCVLL